MSRSRWFLLIATLAAGGVSCAHRFGRTAPPELRLSTNPDVRWEAGGPHHLAVIVENTGSAPTAIPVPSPAHARVVVFATGDDDPVCRKEAEGVAPKELVELVAHERRALVVRLEDCALPPGEYRYEASYLVPEVPGSRWSGPLGPEHGRIVVQRAAATIDRPASRAAVAPPGHAETPVPPLPHDPTGPPPPAIPQLGPAAGPLGPAALSCVDRELARRGLNAWGDPAATVYPEGPPTLPSAVERQRMVLERYPDIATLCRIPP